MDSQFDQSKSWNVLFIAALIAATLSIIGIIYPTLAEYGFVPYDHEHAIFWALSMDAFICIPLIILLFRNLDKIEQFHTWDNVSILGGNDQQNAASEYDKISWNEIFARNWFIIKKQWGWIIFGIILTLWHDFGAI